jgi:hypothetical protein
MTHDDLLWLAFTRGVAFGTQNPELFSNGNAYGEITEAFNEWKKMPHVERLFAEVDGNG